jgi:signal transduction histidine kinase
LGQSCESIFVEDVDCPHRELSEQQPLIEREIFSRAGDYLLSIRVSNFEGADGIGRGFMHVIRDATSARALERHLIEIERMSLAGLMVSSVAHEVATPLSIIANIAEMLLQNSEPGSPASPELEKILTQARHITEMTRRMLDFVRQKPAQPSPVNLAELVCETLDLIEYELKKARIQASYESDPHTPFVWGDRAQLQQVLLNLINNAIQAMKNRGLLTVRIAEDASSVEDKRTVQMTLDDTGPGISPQAIDKMFDFFFTTKIAEGGTGLGLPISRQIVEGYGGTITAENIESGGARFLVRLPAAERRRYDGGR